MLPSSVVGSVAVREPRPFTNAGELPADASRRIWTIVEVGNDSRHERENGGRSRSDKCNCCALTNGLVELAGKEQADAESYRSLRKGDNAGHGESVAKFTV